MKRIFIALLLLCSLTLIFAQVPISLRNYALGSVIDGEWENIYDPIELNFYPQKYYFTNFSDFVQQIHATDDSIQFVQESEFLSEYPFGFTFKSPFGEKIKHSFLIRFKDNHIPSLYDEYGENEVISTNYYDSNQDLIYDMKTVYTTRNKDYKDIGSRLLLLLNSTMPIGDNILGVRISYDRHIDGWDESSSTINASSFSPFFEGFYAGDHTKYTSETDYDLIENRTLFTSSEDGDFTTDTKSNGFNCLFSYMMPTSFTADDSELRYDLSINLNNNNSSSTDDHYYGMYNQYINETSHNEGFYKQDFTKEYSNPKNEVFLNAKFRHNLTESEERLKRSFWEIGVGMGGFGGAYTNETKKVIKSEELYIDTDSLESREYQSYECTDYSKADGSYFGFHANFKARSNVYLSDYVCFGYGVTFDVQSFNRKTKSESSYNATDYYQVGNAFNTDDDYRYSQNRYYSYDQQHTQTNFQTILPIGLEFSLPKDSLTDHDSFSLRNFTLRLGTTLIQDLIKTDSRSQLKDVWVNTTTYEYGNGWTSESHPSNNSFFSTKYVNAESRGSKKYSAGIGYNHSENLSIDLGGYVDTKGEDFFIGAMFTIKK